MKKTLLTAAAATFTVAFAAPAAKADHLTDNLIRQSHRVDTSAQTLAWEFRVHFRYAPQFSILMGDAYAIRKRASEIHGMVHHIHSEAALHRLESKVEDLDRLVHHVGDHIDRASYGPRAVAYGEIRHVRSLIASMTASLHSMEQSVRTMETRFHHPVHSAPGHGRGPDHGHGRSAAERLRDHVIGEVLRHAAGGGRGHDHDHDHGH